MKGEYIKNGQGTVKIQGELSSKEIRKGKENRDKLKQKYLSLVERMKENHNKIINKQ